MQELTFLKKTFREEQERVFLRKTYVDVLNPNDGISWRGSMQPYFDAVCRSEAVVCSEYRGCVGRGVFEEVQVALKNNIKVLVLRPVLLSYDLVPVLGVKRISDGDWRIRYGKLITTK